MISNVSTTIERIRIRIVVRYMLAVHCSLLYYGYILVLALLLLFVYPLSVDMKFLYTKKKK